MHGDRSDPRENTFSEEVTFKKRITVTVNDVLRLPRVADRWATAWMMLTRPRSIEIPRQYNRKRPDGTPTRDSRCVNSANLMPLRPFSRWLQNLIPALPAVSQRRRHKRKALGLYVYGLIVHIRLRGVRLTARITAKVLGTECWPVCMTACAVLVQ
jgi:hypothetical protein